MPIINTLMVHDDLMDNIRLDGVVTLVDAKHVEQHLDDKEKSEGAVNEAVEQIAYADRILLNKVDLVSPVLRYPLSPPNSRPLLQFPHKGYIAYVEQTFAEQS